MLNRNGIRKAVDLLTGHCPLKMHLTFMGVKNDPTCRSSFYMAEIAMHILCEWDGFSAYRFEHLGQHIIELWELHDIPITCLLNYASAASFLRLWGYNRPPVTVLGSLNP